ncbi:C40 family peptidase [Rothia sp. 88186D007BW]
MAKSNVTRTAGIVAASGAMLAATVAPANAFAVAEVSAPANAAPALAAYSYTTWGTEVATTIETTVVENTAVEAPAAVTPQATITAEVPANVNLSNAREAVLAGAYDGIGGAYIWGGKAYKGWDCSGFVSYVYAQAGINLTPYTYAMAAELTPTSNPQPGDIVFTNGYAHVGIYVGNGQMISALNPSQGTQLTSVDGGGFMPVDGFYTVGF